MELTGSCHCGAVSFTVESYTPYPFMRCYCSICRKTAGGGGYAINIMGQADTLKIKGKKAINIYHAKIRSSVGDTYEISSGCRHFCRHCGSALWVSDPNWPDLVHPFASAIDTALPKPLEYVDIMLDYAANWCEIPRGKKHTHYAEYPEESIAHWHRRHHLYKK